MCEIIHLNEFSQPLHIIFAFVIYRLSNQSSNNLLSLKIRATFPLKEENGLCTFKVIRLYKEVMNVLSNHFLRH